MPRMIGLISSMWKLELEDRKELHWRDNPSTDDQGVTGTNDNTKDKGSTDQQPPATMTTACNSEDDNMEPSRPAHQCSDQQRLPPQQPSSPHPHQDNPIDSKPSTETTGQPNELDSPKDSQECQQQPQSKEQAKHINRTERDIARKAKEAMHRTMDQHLEHENLRLEEATARGDTSWMWRRTCRAIEKGWMEHINWLTPDQTAKAVGRGKFQLRETSIGTSQTKDERYRRTSKEANMKEAGRCIRQQRRCKLYADNIRKLHQTVKIDVYTMDQILRENAYYKKAIIRNINTEHEEEAQILAQFHHHSANVAEQILIPAATVAANRYHTRYEEAFRKAKQHQRQQFNLKLEGTTRGQKQISSALNPPSTPPMIALRRTRTGPQEQLPGTTATNPKEVDDMAIEHWSNIYDGADSNVTSRSNRFMENYEGFIFHRDEGEYQIGTVCSDKLKAACTEAKHTAAGPDGWSPDDFSRLSSKAYFRFAKLLDEIEAGRPWPDDLLHPRASFMEQDSSKNLEPTGYRLLQTLPVLYRRWASMRLKELAPWIQ